MRGSLGTTRGDDASVGHDCVTRQTTYIYAADTPDFLVSCGDFQLPCLLAVNVGNRDRMQRTNTDKALVHLEATIHETLT